MRRRKLVKLAISGTLAMILAAFALLAGYRLTVYRDLYSYDVSAPQSYLTTERAEVTLDVPLTETGFAWPELPSTIDTLFLVLDIDTTLLGYWDDPYLEYRVGGTSWRQHFARGAQGIRHVDLTPLIRTAKLAAGEIVTLAGHGIRWDGRSARIAGFSNVGVAGSTTLVLAPHPDDAEMAAFGFYSDSNSTIVTITAGDEGVRGYTHYFSDERDRAVLAGRLRVWDSITVPFLGGVAPENAWNLGYFDGTIETMFENQGQPVHSGRGPVDDIDVFRQLNLAATPRTPIGAPTWTAFVDDLGRVLEVVRPEIIVAPHPFIDAHSDHRFTTVALCQALNEHPLPGARLFLYMNWGIYSEGFPHGPRTSLATLPPWFEDPIPFTGIYSHVLDFDKATMKAIALEGMRDFREFDLRERPSIRVLARDLWRASWYRLMGLRHPVRNPDTPRNASRPNEIFYVVPADEAGSVCGPFLDRWRQGHFRHYQ